MRNKQPSPIAYDYDRQCWVTAPAEANKLRIAQIETELSTLNGPNGREYARFIGLQPGDIAGAIARLEMELAGLNNQL